MAAQTSRSPSRAQKVNFAMSSMSLDPKEGVSWERKMGWDRERTACTTAQPPHSPQPGQYEHSFFF
ncbi:hypothetical protein AALO_G00010010 [Alosa alosa]|uniref:Uncharacterized protein n=1 Tax=Alosa alosa TaxID=278164 RepID=A0AAV6HKL9_9TELE|nr:hypothetical protein AALO_G00010010 [Alosa alosa]